MIFIVLKKEITCACTKSLLLSYCKLQLSQNIPGSKYSQKNMKKESGVKKKKESRVA
jgi:hypothetical protein